ncbi:spore coat associated protein CotJA [Candidatus Clostridium stratigraminis]|uniref:Spore coat associated protein CotJA n=1 Tax=Candidatus Clostridium stratigraminis TaxID=3381661 RepID=A0ABW8T083_9CLOT
MAHDEKPDFNMYQMQEMNFNPKNNCIPQETVIRNVRLAAAYVPYQKLCTILSPLEALTKGTVFPELYSPYEGKDKNTRPFGNI